MARIEHKRTGKPFEKLFIELGFVTDKTLRSITAEHSGLSHLDLSHTVLDSTLIQHLPKEQALKYKILPISLKNNVLQLAMVDVYDVLAMDRILRYFPQDVQVAPVVVTENDLIEAIETYYGHEMTLENLLSEIEQAKVTENDTATHHTIRLVNAIILDAVKQGASDIHFQPEQVFVRLRYRLDGILTQINTFHKDYWPSICVRLKIMSGINIAESRKPQNRRFSFQISAREVDFRVSVHPTIHGENIVLRILDKTNSLLPLDELGFDGHTIQKITNILRRPQGLMVVTGPTGSGKTTTLYSLLNYLNSADVNIMTLEEPIEYQLPMIRQSEINEMVGTTFADGIRSILRQDPDIIFVGEIRDEDTAQMALRAAMTGHQVFTTLHTNNTFGIIHRLCDLGIQPSMLAGHIIGAISQRLVRKLCQHCKLKSTSNSPETILLNLEQPKEIYSEVGCPECRHTGFKGRTSIIEVLEFDDKLNELIASQQSISRLQDYANSKGFTSLVQNGIEKVLSGEISIFELQRCIEIA